MRLNAVASRAISSRPSTGIALPRSWVLATSSTAPVSRWTGRRPARATAQPTTPERAAPTSPMKVSRTRRLSSVSSMPMTRCATWTAPPVLGTVLT
jgi:hypothetical protein